MSYLQLFFVIKLSKIEIGIIEKWPKGDHNQYQINKSVKCDSSILISCLFCVQFFFSVPILFFYFIKPLFLFICIKLKPRKFLDMGNFFASLFTNLFGQKELRILILGLDGAGMYLKS